MIAVASKQPNGSPARAASSLARGLVLAGTYGGGTRDTDGTFWTNTGGATVDYTQGGKAWLFNGTSQALTRSDDKVVVGNKSFTVAVLVTPRGTLTTDTRCFAIGYTGGVTPLFALGTSDITPSTCRLFFRNDGGANMELNVANSFVTGRQVMVICVVDGTTTTLYTDYGSQSGTTPTAPITLDNTAIGCQVRDSGPQAFMNCAVPMWATWNRPITVTEVYRMLVNPWQVFADQNQSRMKLIRNSYVAAGGSFNAAWARGANAVIGVGIHA